MAASPLRALSLLEGFADLPDPRVKRTQRHPLLDVVVLAILAVIGGAEGWDDIALFGRWKLPWLRRFLPLPAGIPSADTFRRVLAALDPDAFHRAFRTWMQALMGSTGGKVIAIDGKTLRGSFDTALGRSPLHLVNAWATENNLLLGQLATDTKSNEVTAIPALLALLALEGAIVTIDAMGCQKAIARTLVGKGADYVLALKNNHPTLYAEVVAFFDEALAHPSAEHPVFEATTVDGGHGRIETRRVRSSPSVGWLTASEAWAGLRSLVCVESTRQVGEATSVERRYYLSSLEGTDPARMGTLVRAHWGVENGLHWVLDVTFREDACRVRKDHGPQNLSLLRKLALNLYKQEPSKLSARQKRLQALWRQDDILEVLGFSLQLRCACPARPPQAWKARAELFT
jgi:predicted transposase YbfD/YdcC